MHGNSGFSAKKFDDSFGLHETSLNVSLEHKY
jgi:hypothetical protein